MPALSVALCAAMMLRLAADAATGAGGGASLGGMATRSPPRAVQSATVRGSLIQVPSMQRATAESGGVGAATASADGGGGVITGRGAGAPCARAALGAVIITNSAAMATPTGARLVMGSP